MKKVLLCPPKYFDIRYQINPWMDTSIKVDHQKILEEYNELKTVYLELGLEVLEIEQDKDLPDMVYAANIGFPRKNLFIKSNFKYDERKRETELAKEYFASKSFTIKELPETAVWEGQGDLLVFEDTYFLGWGKRTTFEAKKYLEEYLNVSITDLKLIDPFFYHLDTCFLILDKHTVAINPQSFEPEGLEKIHKAFARVIEISQEDNKQFACNAVVIDKTIVVGKGISQKLKDIFASYGFKTKEVPMDEYRKGGGSVKCLTLEFY